MSFESITSVPRDRKKELLIEQQQDILIIKINRPKVKNALNRNVVYGLMAAVEKATNSATVKVVVITALGDYFTTGNDLKQIEEYRQPEDFFRGANYILRALIRTFLACPKLLVCLVNGPCIGIGFTLAALCDAVYCTDNVYFQAPFSQLGICPEACSTFTFPQLFGQSWSTKLLIFGEKLTAQEAKQLGFVLEIFPNAELEEKFWPKIKGYTKLPGESLRVTKRLIKANNYNQLINALNVELKEIEKLRQGHVYQETLKNFFKKSLKNEKSKL